MRPFAGSAAKAALRADAMARRDALAEDARLRGSASAAERALAVIAPMKPGVVAVYRAIRTELVPDAIVDWAFAKGLVVVLPAIVDPGSLVFRRYRPGDRFVPGGLGTVAPGPDAPEIDPDLIVVPMVAFDRAGIRLGHGRGYYDRGVLALHAKGLRPPLVGLAFSVQEVAAIPTEPHDVGMDWIVTEKETIDLRHLG